MSKTRKSNLAASLNLAAKGSQAEPTPETPAPNPPAQSAARSQRAKVRQDKRMFGGFITPESLKHIKQVGLELDMTNQQIIVDAVNLWLESKGKAGIVE